METSVVNNKRTKDNVVSDLIRVYMLVQINSWVEPKCFMVEQNKKHPE